MNYHRITGCGAMHVTEKTLERWSKEGMAAWEREPKPRKKKRRRESGAAKRKRKRKRLGVTSDG